MGGGEYSVTLFLFSASLFKKNWYSSFKFDTGNLDRQMETVPWITLGFHLELTKYTGLNTFACHTLQIKLRWSSTKNHIYIYIYLLPVPFLFIRQKNPATFLELFIIYVWKTGQRGKKIKSHFCMSMCYHDLKTTYLL